MADGNSGKRQTYRYPKKNKMPSLKRMLTNRYLVLVVRLIVGGIFVFASINKIKHPEQFALIVYNYKILPHFAINFFAITLPWLEMVCGLFLISGIMNRSSALLVSFLLVIFIMALSINLLRGVDLSCGCFTTNPAAKEHISSLLWRDFVLLFLSLYILLFAGKHQAQVQKDKAS